MRPARASNADAGNSGAELYLPRRLWLQTGLIAGDDSGFRSCLFVTLLFPFKVADQLLGFADVVACQFPGLNQVSHHGLRSSAEKTQEILDGAAVRLLARGDRLKDVGVPDLSDAPY